MSSPEHNHRIDYVELPVRDIARSKAFDVSAFGWHFTDYGPEYTSFNDGRLSSGLRQEAAVTTGGALLVIYACHLEAARARVLAAGGRLCGQDHAFPGGRRVHFTDPDGHELAVRTTA